MFDPGTGALEPYQRRVCSYHGLLWSLFQRLQQGDHQLGSAGIGDSDPYHWYPNNVGLYFGYGGYAPLRLAHSRQLPHNRVSSTNTNGQHEAFGDITNAEDGLALADVTGAEKWNPGRNN